MSQSCNGLAVISAIVFAASVWIASMCLGGVGRWAENCAW